MSEVQWYVPTKNVKQSGNFIQHFISLCYYFLLRCISYLYTCVTSNIFESSTS